MNADNSLKLVFALQNPAQDSASGGFRLLIQNHRLRQPG